MKKTLVTTLLALTFLAQTAIASIPNFSKVNDWVYRGAQPQAQADYDELVAMGVKTIVNFRQTTYAVYKEEKRWKAALKRAGKTGYFIHMPFSGLLGPSQKLTYSILQKMTDPALLPVFVHCRKGMDRTGMMVGLYRIHAEKWDVQTTYKEMLHYGFGEYLLLLKHAFFKYTDWNELSKNLDPWSD